MSKNYFELQTNFKLPANPNEEEFSEELTRPLKIKIPKQNREQEEPSPSEDEPVQDAPR